MMADERRLQGMCPPSLPPLWGPDGAGVSACPQPQEVLRAYRLPAETDRAQHKPTTLTFDLGAASVPQEKHVWTAGHC